MSDEDPFGELDPDDIARWAEGLSPDGSPGILAAHARLQLGDEGYEKMVAYQDTVSKLYLQKQSSIASIWSMVGVYLVLYGLVGFVAIVTLLIKFIF
jgi:hypothetical protein